MKSDHLANIPRILVSHIRLCLPSNRRVFAEYSLAVRKNCLRQCIFFRKGDESLVHPFISQIMRKNSAVVYGMKFPPILYVSNLVFVFLRLQFHFVNYVIVSCELPYYNSFDQQMLLKN